VAAEVPTPPPDTRFAMASGGDAAPFFGFAHPTASEPSAAAFAITAPTALAGVGRTTVAR
jgi:hypothetical protein